MQQGTQALPTTAERRGSKWLRMDWLRDHSMRKRAYHCQMSTRGDRVTVRNNGQAVGFAGLQTCGSLSCPHCGIKIAAERESDIKAAVMEASRRGHVLLFGTFNLRHHRGQSLDFLMDTISKCWHRMMTGAGGRRDRDHFGIIGNVRVWETTGGGSFGWHVHVHFLLVIDPNVAAIGMTVKPDLIKRSLFARWSDAAESAGMRAPMEDKQDLRVVTGATAGDQFGDYFSKTWRNGDVEHQTPAGMAREMTAQTTKTGHAIAGRRRSYTPAQLLTLAAVDGDTRSSWLWSEYELAMIGRRTIGWSRGLRDYLGLNAERTDEEIAAEEIGDRTDDVLELEPHTFQRAAKRRGFRGKLLGLVAALDYVGAIEFARSAGVICDRIEHDPPPRAAAA